MFRRIDRSPLLSRLLEKLSTLLAKQRGLPVVIGIALVIIGFVLQLIDVYADNTLIRILGLIAHSGGVLIALIGLLLAEPLGK
jgi:hypothetical protein